MDEGLEPAVGMAYVLKSPEDGFNSAIRLPRISVNQTVPLGETAMRSAVTVECGTWIMWNVRVVKLKFPMSPPLSRVNHINPSGATAMP
jgi:hypothetical protein